MANDFSNDPNCVALYKFDNGALTADSIGGNTLTSHGSPTADTGDYQEGDASVALSSATPDYYDRADADLDAGFPFKSGGGASSRVISICGWFKCDAFPGGGGYHILAMKHEANKAGFQVCIYNNSGTFRIRKGDPGGATYENADFTTDCATGIWYHFGVTYSDVTDQYRIRIWDDNAGALLDSDVTGSFSNAGNSEDGSWWVSHSSTITAWDGHVDELVVFKDVLTADEIDQIRQQTYAPVDLAGQSDISIAASGTLQLAQGLAGQADVVVTGEPANLTGARVLVSGQADIVVGASGDLTGAGVELAGQADIAITPGGAVGTVRLDGGSSSIQSWQKYDITIIRTAGGGGGGGGGQNDFSDDPNCMAAWLFESGAFMEDSIGIHDLTEEDAGGILNPNTADYQEGASSAQVSDTTSVVYASRYGLAMAADFPHIIGDTDKTASYTFWFKLEAVIGGEPDQQWVYQKYIYDSAYKYTLSIVLYTTGSVTTLRLYISSAGSSYDQVYAHASTILLNRWYHVGVVVENTGGGFQYRIRIWDRTAQAILGADKTGSCVEPYVHNTGSEQVMLFGYGSNTTQIVGKLDEFTVWDAALTTAQIDDIRNQVS